MREPGYAVGVDAGGTSTRALLVDAAGRRCGTGHSEGANPNSHPPREAAAHITEAITSALGELEPTRVWAAVIGMAGASKLNDPDVATIFDAAWDDIGLADRPHILSDAETAFASATGAADGTVLVAGTGSIAARIRQRQRVAVAGGYGWLLGDEGSAFWIGREAVRTTLDALTGEGSLGALAHAVLEQARLDPPVSPDPREGLRVAHQLITVVNRAPPIELATFAPLVSANDTAGDSVAAKIDARAARLLAETTMRVRADAEATPVVLVGSVLGAASPVGARVRAELDGLEVHTSKDGMVGAAWLAALRAFGEGAARPAEVSPS